jgi:hypothetical protein
MDAFIGMLTGFHGTNAKLESLARGLKRKGFTYLFPVEPPTTEMVRHGFLKRNEDGTTEWKVLNERANGFHNVTAL